MADTVKIQITVSAGGTHYRDDLEVPHAEWDAMSGEQRDTFMEGAMVDAIGNHVETWWEIVDDE